MTGSKMIDLDTVIGMYGLTNTGAVLVHAIDYGEEKILASINGENPEWCRMMEQYVDSLEEETLGFLLGELFIPLCEVMRFYEYV
ncbi:MAG: hypothetical protein K6E41_06825 [Solobacterium sp.]|nr:hypothetical protein [Solobacterium sp.]